MLHNKMKNVLKFYLLATKLKDTIRSGWKIWHVKKERLESVAEHVYGTCILAIAMDSEFQLDLDLNKVIYMLVLHELEEVIIGDLTPFDCETESERRSMGSLAVGQILSPLTKRKKYLDLLNEFEEEKTPESKFSKMIDKFECDLQVKIYCENGLVDLFDEDNKYLSEKSEVKSRIESLQIKSLADLFIEYDRRYFSNNSMENVIDFIKKQKLLELNKSN